MKKFLRIINSLNWSKLNNNPFFWGSVVMIVGSNLHNFGQLLFHFMSGKMLTESDYGELATVISILGFISVFQGAFGLAIVKFISSQKDENEVSNLINWFQKWGIIMAVIVSAVTLVTTPFLVSFLKIHNVISLYLLVPALFIYILATTYRSILQALLKFNSYIISLLVEVWAKLPFAFFLIYLGFGVTGAMLALTIGVIIACIVAKRSLKVYFAKPSTKSPDFMKILKYCLPAFIQGAAMTSMYTFDLLLVKHFFPSDTAGIYASLVVLGRIVLFGSSPIINVMFPLVVKKYSHGEPYHNIFYMSIISIIGFSGIIVLIYYIFPEIILGLLYKNTYLKGAPLLWWFGLFTLVLSLCQLFTQFYLSIGKTKIVGLFGVAAILQIGLIYFNHNSLLNVIQQSLIASTLLLIVLIVYLPLHDKKL